MGDEIFCTRPDRRCGAYNHLSNGYRDPLRRIKQPECSVDHPPQSTAEVKERVELNLYTHSGPSQPVTGSTLPLNLPSLLHMFGVN